MMAATSKIYSGNKETVVADFMAQDTIVTVGDLVEFTNLSSGNPTLFQWHIEGATPSIVYAENPNVIFNIPGVYDVQLIASGANGADTLLKIDYIQVLQEQSVLPPGWEYSTSVSQHTIIIFQESNPRIFETPIEPGDHIGVFYEDYNGEYSCGGAVQWEGDGNTAIVAQGDNYFTPAKDGFMVGETFTWKLYSWQHEQEFAAEATYDPQMPLNIFIPNAISLILDLSAGTVFNITIPQGWSGISSFVQPWFANLDALFEPHLDDVEMIFDGTGHFQPDKNLNTIGNWENKGYQIKLKNSITVEFAGYPTEQKFVNISYGWNILPIPDNCTYEVAELLDGHLNKVSIIREIAGHNMYWPDYAIFTLGELQPGKAYFLQANETFILEFEACE